MAPFRPAYSRRIAAGAALTLATPLLLGQAAPPTLSQVTRAPILASPAAAPDAIALDPILLAKIAALVGQTRASGHEHGICVTLGPGGLAVRDVPAGDANRIAIRCTAAPNFVGDAHTHPTDDFAPSQTDLGNVVGAGKRVLLVADRAGRSTLVLDTAQGRRARGPRPNRWIAYNAAGASSFLAATLVSGIDPGELGGFDAAADLADRIAIAGACRLLGLACYTADRPGDPMRLLSVDRVEALLRDRASSAGQRDAMRRADAALAWLANAPADFAPSPPETSLDLARLWRALAAMPVLGPDARALETMRDRRLLPIQLGRARILWLDGVRTGTPGGAYRTINFDRASGRPAWPMCLRTGVGVRLADSGRIGSSFVGDVAAADYRIRCVPRAGQAGMPVALTQTIADGAIRTSSSDGPEQTARIGAMCVTGAACVLAPATITYRDQAPR